MRVLVICSLFFLLSGCAQNIGTGNQDLSPRLASLTLHAGHTSRGQAFQVFGSPNTISYTDQVLWPYAGHEILYPPGTREIWSYYASSVTGMASLNYSPVRSRRQLIKVFFDERGIVTGWDAIPLNN
ncbi:hypothetical protein C2E25_11810 [Geothermobacter hydrogeniphilus]|uniref:SmpA / OmlA family protein n=2 Tax=Geothermobacter hydrogeniphilus TaxID=1969733 RepID=A0A2K2H887_9BACT|nr:hypothetical protein C2E25_11810 [Geothermobacter hydrogeniphilus]